LVSQNGLYSMWLKYLIFIDQENRWREMESDGKDMYFETVNILKSKRVSEQEILSETCYILSTMLHMRIFPPKSIALNWHDVYNDTNLGAMCMSSKTDPLWE
jgi:hypothetical protein